MRALLLFTTLVSLLALEHESPAASAAPAAKLRAGYLENPLGLDSAQPRLSWIATTNQRDAKQTAYQILAATSEAKLRAAEGDLWDSGKVASDQTSHVLYAG